MRYLLDSTLLIDHANADPAAMALLADLHGGNHLLLTCDVVTCEVLSRGDEAQLRHLRALLDGLEYVATHPDAARAAGGARLARHRAGGRLGLGDALIGAVATRIGATVVTRNRPDFERHGISVLTY